MNRMGLGLAIGAGYVLGRTKKAKLALAVGSLVAGKKLNLTPRALGELLAQQLKDNPQFKAIGDELRQDLRGVGKAASGALVERQIEALADRLHGRTAEVRDQLQGVAPGGGKDDEAEEAEEPEGEHEEPDTEEETEGEEPEARDEDEEEEPEARDEDEEEEAEEEPEGREEDEDEEDEEDGEAEASEEDEEPARKRAARKAPASKAAKSAPARKTPARKPAAKKTGGARKTAARSASRSGGSGGGRTGGRKGGGER
ncbi:DNA primase [Streptomyces sp. NPDC000345]|uniref:DNA primase n=1 Tax=Streptomyces sp. NPDC000345 TaxID=3364537 RepID=UPI0036C695EB